MKASIERYSKKLKQGPETGIEIRIGLHSGEGVVLEVGDDPKNPEYFLSEVPEVLNFWGLFYRLNIMLCGWLNELTSDKLRSSKMSY